MRNAKVLSCGLYSVFVAILLFGFPHLALAQANPCAPKAKQKSLNPCAANPCAAKNPCAANPCAPGGRSAGAGGKAITVRGEVARVEPGSGKLVLKADGKQLDLTLSKYSVVRAGSQVKRLANVKPGEKVTVSYVESGKDRTAWYVYLASAAPMGNPCAANPCAVKNPCGPGQPCAPKAKKASQNPCAAKNPCAANPCAPKVKKAK